MIDEFESIDPHDHSWSEALEQMITHRLAHPKPLYDPGSYAILHADYVTLAREFTLASLDELNSTRAHWIALPDVNKRAIANALAEVIREKEIALRY